MYTHLVKTGIISINKLTELMAVNPRVRFKLPFGRDFSVWRLDEEFTVDPSEFLSKGKATPFSGHKLSGRCYATVKDGKLVWKA